MAKQESRLRRIARFIKLGTLGGMYKTPAAKRYKKMQKSHLQRIKEARKRKRLETGGTMRMSEAW